MYSKYTLLDLLHVQTAVMLSSGCLFSKRGYLEFFVAILRNCRPSNSMESRIGQICIFCIVLRIPKEIPFYYVNKNKLDPKTMITTILKL